MMPDISIKLLESNNTIMKKIHMGLANILNKTLSQNAAKISTELRPLISSALLSSPELNSLSGGGLRIDFGLTSDPSSAIVSAIVSSLDIEIQNTTASAAGIKGGLLITMQPIDYNNLFSLSVAEQITEKGVSLPWLQWLLTFGQQIVVGNYGVEYGAGRGRTGGGHMTIEQRPFKVNSAYAGTVDNNFITRTIDAISSQIKSIIIKAVQ
tara:strand:- start:40 stop:669 length:630 start_codon:yes stop_codon:yes gene_type:complete